MKRCYCRSCRARDEARFWRLVATLREREPLRLPPIPEWDGVPRELHLTPKEG